MIEIKDTETGQKETIEGIDWEQAVLALQLGAHALSLIPEGHIPIDMTKVVCGNTNAVQILFQPKPKELTGVEFFESLDNGAYFYYEDYLITKMENGLHWETGTVWTWDDKAVMSDGSNGSRWQNDLDAGKVFMEASYRTLKIHKPEGAEK